MSVPASELGSHTIDTDPGLIPPDADAAAKVAGKSPTQLALARFRKDRLSMTSFVIVVLYTLLAIAAPFLVHWGVLDPYSIHNSNKILDINLGSVPRGSFGGVSWDHPLGIEPGTGRDVMSRLILGITYSLTISISATIITESLIRRIRSRETDNLTDKMLSVMRNAFGGHAMKKE